MDYNLVYEAENISEDSGPVTEPVTLQEVKDYLRLEGFGGDSTTGLAVQTPLSLPFTSGLFVFNALLQNANAVVTSVVREGVPYSPQNPLSTNRGFLHDTATGRITFLVASNGDETVDVNYGLTGQAGTLDEFDFDDTLIETMIQGAREWCESVTGCSLVWKRIQVPVTNLCGGVTIPHGPVIGAITALNSNGDDISGDVRLIGTKFPALKLPKLSEMVLTYDAGYNILTCPGGLKDAIKAHVAACYENRGDQGKADLSLAAKMCGPYIKGSAWA